MTMHADDPVPVKHDTPTAKPATPAADPAAPPIQEFPKWLYGPDGASQVVESKAAQEKLGAGWSETPHKEDAAKATPHK